MLYGDGVGVSGHRTFRAQEEGTGSLVGEQLPRPVRVGLGDYGSEQERDFLPESSVESVKSQIADAAPGRTPWGAWIREVDGIASSGGGQDPHPCVDRINLDAVTVADGLHSIFCPKADRHRSTEPPLCLVEALPVLFGR